jgi:Ferritin-like domain
VTPGDRRPEGISRRSILAIAGAAAGGVLLDGCGSKAAKPAPNSEVNGADADLLNEVFMLENMAVAAYAHVAGSLTGRARALAETIGHQESQHASKLEPAIRELGGRPTPAARSYAFPTLTGGPAALAFVGGIEDNLIAAYIDVVPKISNPIARALAASIVTNEAQHLALVTQARGLRPTPDAIVRGAAA